MSLINLSISIPEYTIDQKPDYLKIGNPVDALIESHYKDGDYVVRAIGSVDHPGKNTDDLIGIICHTGTDKYDPSRQEVASNAFRGYNHDFHASHMSIKNGRIITDEDDDVPSLFGDFVYHFYEHTILDRGYSVRIDILSVYDFKMMTRAQRVDPSAPPAQARHEDCLFRFKDPSHKLKALVGTVKILP